MIHLLRSALSKELVDDYRACAVDPDAHVLRIDETSERYKALLRKHKYQSRPSAKPKQTVQCKDKSRLRRLWGELHQKVGADQAWLDDWIGRIKCAGCEKHFREVVAANPPPFNDGWFSWTVLVHNLVNRKLGKSEVTEEAARRVWGVEKPELWGAEYVGIEEKI